MRRLMIVSAAVAGLAGLAACGEQRPEETETARSMPDTGAAATEGGDMSQPATTPQDRTGETPQVLPAEEPTGTETTSPPSP